MPSEGLVGTTFINFMKKNKFFAFAIMLVMAFSACVMTSCSDDDDNKNLIGYWYAEYNPYGLHFINKNTLIKEGQIAHYGTASADDKKSLQKDGFIEHWGNSDYRIKPYTKETLTYVVDGNKIITSRGGIYTIDGDRLVEEGYSWESGYRKIAN